jgi:hypothetical protein
MNTRTYRSATLLLIVAGIALSIILYGAASFPSSITDGGWAVFIAAVVPLSVYFSVGMWARRGSARIQAPLRIGTVAGLAMAAIGVLYHAVEISTALPASMGAVVGGGMWGAMFLTFGIACSTTFSKERSAGLGVLSSAWCGMVYAALLVACALAMAMACMPHMQRIFAPAYSASGMQDPQAFVVRHEVGAAGEHLFLVPVVASFVGLVSGVACLFLISMSRQAVLVISIVAMLLFAAGVVSIRFATSLERAQRPPFVLFGLAALAVTLASAHPLFIAIRSPRSPGEGGC